ncbi:hypothetical protein SAMN04487912_101254 [Arthrobacter sp. cf158]|uniref:SLATT domain-containing protein n=1 Tax=Arthrobacter sp. cf158 TaxID=1761744 RepID=UPI00089D547B|nr:SLATT domain-containing protein [Arthrobacter sp. cf158]SDW04760.1 hypothetical protein SAMN04487912_101254 [Arthrobacter sp. cf158]
MGSLEKLEDRSFKSYKGRMHASQRLALRDKAWNASLLSLTVATTIASVGLLADSRMYGSGGPTIFVCLAVLSLVISLVVAGLNYGARSRDLFNNYRRIQRLSTEVEHLRTRDHAPDYAEVKVLLDRYNDLLDDSENHNASDFARVGKSGRWSWLVLRDRSISALPFVTLLVPIGVLVPFVQWLMRAV